MPVLKDTTKETRFDREKNRRLAIFSKEWHSLEPATSLIGGKFSDEVNQLLRHLLTAFFKNLLQIAAKEVADTLELAHKDNLDD